MRSDQLVVGATLQILDSFYEVVEVVKLDLSHSKQLSIEPPDNASAIIISSDENSQPVVTSMKDLRSLQELITAKDEKGLKMTLVFINQMNNDPINSFIASDSINSRTSSDFFTPDSNIEEVKSITDAERVIEYLQNWGINFAEMERVVSMPMEGTVVTLPKYSNSGEYEESSYQERTEFYPESIILERLVDEIKRQLVEKNVRYSKDTSLNKYAKSNDIRVQLLVAETVGLDCDGLSFLITMIADAFFKSVETINIQGKYRMIDEYGNPVIIDGSNYEMFSDKLHI